MDLIEQLGYDTVKQEAINYRKSGDVVTSAVLEQKCLEYRRQHNKYERNDKVVLIDGNDLGDDRIFYVDYDGWCTNLSVLSKQQYKDIRGYTYPKQWFRHATDAEIEAGYRLPEKDKDV